MRIVGWLALILWAAVLYLGHEKAERNVTGCRLRRELPAQYRLRGGDLDCSPAAEAMRWEGLYLSQPGAKGAELQPRNTANVPEIGAGNMYYLNLRTKSEVADELNVGSVVDLVVNGAVAVLDARVAALVCDDRTVAHCTAAVTVTKGQEPKSAPDVYIKKR